MKMHINIRELFPIIEINMETQKANLNAKAKEEFEDVLDEIVDIIKSLDFDKKMQFAYIGNNFYAINIIKGIKYLYLCFTKLDDTDISKHTIKGKNSSVAVDVYSKDILKEFLEKFLALKRRYGGFHIKLLYLRVEFVIDVKRDIKREFVEKILKYTVAVTRSSDVVGQLGENSFGIILTNANTDGANVVAEKITKYISEINFDHDKRILDLYACLTHELFILKHTDFEELIDLVDKNTQFLTVGIKLKELVQ